MVPFYTAPSARLLSFVGLFFGFGSGPRGANEANRDCKLFFSTVRAAEAAGPSRCCFTAASSIFPSIQSIRGFCARFPQKNPQTRTRAVPLLHQSSASTVACHCAEVIIGCPEGTAVRNGSSPALMRPEGQGLIASGLVCVAFVYFFQHPASAFNNSFSSHEEAAEISSASVLYASESTFRYENGDFWRIRISLFSEW